MLAAQVVVVWHHQAKEMETEMEMEIMAMAMATVTATATTETTVFQVVCIYSACAMCKRDWCILRIKLQS